MLGSIHAYLLHLIPLKKSDKKNNIQITHRKTIHNLRGKKNLEGFKKNYAPQLQGGPL